MDNYMQVVDYLLSGPNRLDPSPVNVVAVAACQHQKSFVTKHSLSHC